MNISAACSHYHFSVITEKCLPQCLRSEIVHYTLFLYFEYFVISGCLYFNSTFMTLFATLHMWHQLHPFILEKGDPFLANFSPATFLMLFFLIREKEVQHRRFHMLYRL